MSTDPLAGLQSILHHPARIRIMSRLIVRRRMRFHALRDATGLTSGNLSAHLQSLADAGYVLLRAGLLAGELGKFAQITTDGDAAFRAYVADLEKALLDLRSNMPQPAAEPETSGPPDASAAFSNPGR